MDLQRYLHDEPVLAVAPSARYRTMKFVRRHRAGLAVTAALFGMLVAGVIVSSWQMVRARQAEKLAENRLKEVEKERQAAVAAHGQAEAVSEFLVEAFRSPDPERDGRTVTVAEVLDQAATNLMGRFEDAPGRIINAVVPAQVTWIVIGGAARGFLGGCQFALRQ